MHYNIQVAEHHVTPSSSCFEYRDHQYSAEQEDQEQSGCDDVRMMLDETSFSFSELSALESLRSSLGGSIDSISSSHKHLKLSQREAEGDRSGAAPTATFEEKEDGPNHSVLKYANFLKVGWKFIRKLIEV